MYDVPDQTGRSSSSPVPTAAPARRPPGGWPRAGADVVMAVRTPAKGEAGPGRDPRPSTRTPSSRYAGSTWPTWRSVREFADGLHRRRHAARPAGQQRRRDGAADAG